MVKWNMVLVNVAEMKMKLIIAFFIMNKEFTNHWQRFNQRENNNFMRAFCGPTVRQTSKHLPDHCLLCLPSVSKLYFVSFLSIAGPVFHGIKRRLVRRLLPVHFIAFFKTRYFRRKRHFVQRGSSNRTVYCSGVVTSINFMVCAI
jgi:hypothetical protein